MEQAIRVLDVAAFKTAIPANLVDDDKERASVVAEKLIRERAMELVKNKSSIEEIERHFLFVVALAKEDLCPKALTVTVMQDLLECSPKNKCAEIFTIVENHIDIWKSQEFFDVCKNNVLRMCNDLLKRLSRTIDTQFCGRVNILLARSLPLFEKSGLNITGQFNTSNDTGYDQEVDESELKSSGDVDPEQGVEIEMTQEIPVDFKLYQKFWGLQKYFCDPNKIYQKSAFEVFQENMNEVLSVFSTYKLDKRRGNKEYELQVQKMEGIEESLRRPDVFFAKYQTSQKLLHLQFADPQFRRYFFVQVLILCNYLQSDVKFRDCTLFLTEDQSKHITEVTERCSKLLRDTFPRGFQFGEFVKKLLSREKVWSSWKNEGCPDWLASRGEKQLKPFKKQDIEHYDPSKIDLGNKALNALWNFSPDNLSACRDSKRNFIPSVEEVVEEALDHADPEQGVEPEYSCFNNEVWQWKNNRLFLTEADSYLNVQSTPAGKKPCPEYSEVMQKGVFQVAIQGTNETLKFVLLFFFAHQVTARFYRNVPYANIYGIYKPAEIEPEVPEPEEPEVPEIKESDISKMEESEIAEIKSEIQKIEESEDQKTEESEFPKMKESKSKVLSAPPPPAHLFILRPDYALMKINTIANAVKSFFQKRWMEKTLEE
ncbi:hypothetical protein FO519_004915 [Halicephalobus sp. NKZ332]|nr:hypothetical protein FO519_004915 [Halicephalobus sp. NKZ332]